MTPCILAALCQNLGGKCFTAGTRRHIREDGILKHIFIFFAQS